MKVTARKNATFESTEPLKNMCLLYLRASNLPNFKRNTVSFLYNQLFAHVDNGDWMTAMLVERVPRVWQLKKLTRNVLKLNPSDDFTPWNIQNKSVPAEWHRGPANIQRRVLILADFGFYFFCWMHHHTDPQADCTVQQFFLKILLVLCPAVPHTTVEIKPYHTLSIDGNCWKIMQRHLSVVRGIREKWPCETDYPFGETRWNPTTPDKCSSLNIRAFVGLVRGNIRPL